MEYDPLLAKLAVWAGTREAAIARMLRALREYDVGGIKTNIAFFRQILDDPEFRAGRLAHRLHRRVLRTHPAAAAPRGTGGHRGSGRRFARESGRTSRRSSARKPLARHRTGGPAAMKRTLTINGRDCVIEILAPAPACRFRLEDQANREAHVESPEPGVYSILIEGRSYDAFVTETPAGLAVSVDGHRFEVTVRDPRQWSRTAAGQGGEGVQTIASPMPGKVVRLLAAAGDEVQPGQGIVVVEAMKMQNEMKADRAGKVLALPAREGATVTAGEVLATVG